MVCAGCLKNYGSFCSTDKRLLLSPKCQEQLWNPPTSYSLTTSATSLVVKRSGCKDDHSHSFSAEVKNEWNSIPHTTPPCAQRQLYFYPYHTAEKIKCKRIINIFFTAAGIQNLLPDLEKKKTISASQKRNSTMILSELEWKFIRKEEMG
jgi:hypothetical protein